MLGGQAMIAWQSFMLLLNYFSKLPITSSPYGVSSICSHNLAQQNMLLCLRNAH